MLSKYKAPIKRAEKTRSIKKGNTNSEPSAFPIDCPR
jgi:hypothetical protein